MDFIALYSVAGPIVRPIVAKPKQLLAVWPANPTRTLIVHADVPGYPVLRTAVVEMGKLYGLVLHWELDGVIIPLTPSSSLAARIAAQPELLRQPRRA